MTFIVPPKKIVAVIGATGAQGMEIVPYLLRPNPDGTSSPYGVRVITRNAAHHRARYLQSLGAEIFEGSFCDMVAMSEAFKGCYGAFVNTDTYTVGEEKEIWCGIKLYETAYRTPGFKHFIWSNLDYGSKIGDYDPMYKTEHHDSKGIVNEFLKSQPSGERFTWTSITSGVYMEMLKYPLCGPLNVRADGTFVFAAPIQDGHIPMIALEDLGWFTRYVLDNREQNSGKDLLICSDWVGWDYLVETFTKVTGKPAVHRRLSLDEWFACMKGTERPIANEKKIGDGSTTIRQNFSGFWSLWRDNMIKRDMDYISKLHPNRLTLEKWMRKNNYNGVIGSTALKNAEDGKGRVIPNPAVVSSL
ncbi:nmrA-family protein [Cyathus striatus]|nr:nmrA-family protein [Cyathus striatus]